jgi:hypothetical protein
MRRAVFVGGFAFSEGLGVLLVTISGGDEDVHVG